MAIINAARQFSGSNRSTNAERTPSEFFANLGFEIVDPATGEPMFIQLEGVTCSLDKLSVRRAFGSNETLIKGIEKTNNWTNGVKAIMGALEPGESSPTLNLQLQIRRTKPVEEVAAPTLDMEVQDPFLAAALAKMKAKVSANAEASVEPNEQVSDETEFDDSDA